MRQHGLAGALHMLHFRVVAYHLQGEIGFDRAAHIEFAAMKERPAAMRALARTNIGREARFHFIVDFIEEMIEQHIFGRNGGVRLKVEKPMPVFLPRVKHFT